MSCSSPNKKMIYSSRYIKADTHFFLLIKRLIVARCAKGSHHTKKPEMCKEPDQENEKEVDPMSDLIGLVVKTILYRKKYGKLLQKWSSSGRICLSGYCLWGTMTTFWKVLCSL